MKKLLALVLALVMTLSLCVTSNAAYKDAADVDLDEAVDVLTTVGVFQGDESGNFNAKANLTREQAAKLVAYLQVGQKAADALVGGGKFADVAKDRWSAGYVDYCASTGVVAGVGDGKFDPAGSLTALQFGKMLLVCLGYDAVAEGLTGADWTINTSKLMTSAKLLKGLDAVNANTVITREQAAQMMLNALKAPMVEYETKGASISVNGAVINFGGSTASYVTSTVAKEQNISKTTLTNANEGRRNNTLYTVELGEKLFPKLELDSTTDDFQRPAHKWTFQSKKIGTYADAADYTYTGKVTQDELYDTLGKTACTTGTGNYTWYVYLNGESKSVTVPKNNEDGAYGFTQAGRITEVFVDTDDKTVTVVYIDQYFAQVSKAKVNGDGDTVITLAQVDNFKFPTVEDKTFKSEDFEVDDYVVFTATAKEIISVYAPEVVTGKVTAVNKETTGENKGNSYLKLDDVKYSYNKNTTTDAKFAHPTLKEEYELYLDNNGFVVGYVAVDDTLAYLYVKNAAEYLGDVTAKVVLADGTKATIDVANKLGSTKKTATEVVKAVNGKVCTYTVDEKDVYTLKVVDSKFVALDKTGVDIENKSAYVGGVLADKNTVFVDVTDNVTYTGYENVPDYDDAVVIGIDEKANKTNKVLDLVFVISYATKNNTDGTFFYVADVDDFETAKDADNVVYALRGVYVNGEYETMLFTDAVNKTITKAGLYKAETINEDEYVTSIKEVGVAKFVGLYDVDALGEATFENDQTLPVAPKSTAISTKYWYYDEETVFVVVDGTYYKEKASGGKEQVLTVEAGSEDDIIVHKDSLIDGDDVTYVTVVKADKNKAQLVYIYVIEHENLAETCTVSFNANFGEVPAPMPLKRGDNATVAYTVPAGYQIKTVTGATASAKTGDVTLTFVVPNSETGTVAIVLEPVNPVTVVIKKDENPGQWYAHGADTAVVAVYVDGNLVGKGLGTYELPNGATATLKITTPEFDIEEWNWWSRTYDYDLAVEDSFGAVIFDTEAQNNTTYEVPFEVKSGYDIFWRPTGMTLTVSCEANERV